MNVDRLDVMVEDIQGLVLHEQNQFELDTVLVDVKGLMGVVEDIVHQSDDR